MVYYKIAYGDYGYVLNNIAFLNGELLTAKEIKEYHIPKEAVEEICIPKSKTYTYYGMRREC